MATLIVTPAQLELINSLSQDEIPIKLRCAICSRLAVNAFRLPCCDQAICESCQFTLPTTCPVCEHSPVSAEDCKPHKALRTTIKVFLRTEEKKREALRLKEIKEATPIPQVEVPAPVEITIPETQEISVEADHQSSGAEEQGAVETIHDAEQTTQAQKDVPHQSIEEISTAQEPIQTNGEDANITVGNENGVEQLESTDENTKEGSKAPSVGLDGTATGAFPGMGIGTDFNQMQMLMAMQNGMGAGGFNNFPMMAMPGMNMDPMMMQSMFMNGGFGAGMGMNGMNMGMGMGGFDGGVGAGYNGGWNAQQTWNVGPDNFNHPNAAGMMGHGDYRASNSGYAPNASGFNPQGNYGRSQYNDFQNNAYGNNQGYQSRGRGRGRGFGGRGGYGHGAQDFSHQVPLKFGQQPNGPSSETASIPQGPKSETGPANVDEYGRELRPKSESRVVETEQPEGESVAVAEVADGGAKDGEVAAEMSTEVAPQQAIQTEESQRPEQDYENTPMPIKSLDEEENSAYAYGNNGYNVYGQGAYSQPQHHGGRPSFNAMQMQQMQPPISKAVDVPINAPTGPKAMREGLPNVGYRGGRQAYQVVQRTTNGSVSGSVAAESDRGDASLDYSEKEKRFRDRDRDGHRKRSRSRSRSRSRERTSGHRSRRHRSEEQSEDEKETERRRERRRERRKRRENEEEAASKDKVDDLAVVESGPVVDGEEQPEERSRSASPREESKRSSHHRSSRREKDKHRDTGDRDRDRERDREHKSRHRSHRSRHEDRDRSRSRDRDRDRERRRHSRRDSVEPDDKDNKEEKEKERGGEKDTVSRRQSVISTTNGLEIRGASARSSKPLSSEKEKSSRHRENGESRTSKDNRESNSHSHSHSHPYSHSHSHSRRESTATSGKPPNAASSSTTTAVGTTDPHTLEREARNRERILKEAQKLASMIGGGNSGKRSRDDGEKGSGRKKGRRGGMVSEELDDVEGRMKRLEAEREGSRWG